MNRFEFADQGPEMRAQTAGERAERLARESESRRDFEVESRRSSVREGDRFVSETAGATLVPDDPAPLSSALGIPTLLKETPHERDPRPRPDNPAPFSSLLRLPVLLDERETRDARYLGQSRYSREHDNARTAEAPISNLRFQPKRSDYERAHIEDAPTQTNYPLTRNDEALLPTHYASAPDVGFSTLDMVAAFFAALMTIGPLFAAFVGRMEG